MYLTFLMSAYLSAFINVKNILKCHSVILNILPTIRIHLFFRLQFFRVIQKYYKKKKKNNDPINELFRKDN